jgi:hypothetical protein
MLSRTAHHALLVVLVLGLHTAARTDENPPPQCPAIGSTVRVTVIDSRSEIRICDAQVSVSQDEGSSTCTSYRLSADCEYLGICHVDEPGEHTVSVTAAGYRPSAQKFVVESGICGTESTSIQVRLESIDGPDGGAADSAPIGAM